MPKYVNPKTAGAMMNVTRHTAVRYARAGKLPFILTPGGHMRIDADAIPALMEASQRIPWHKINSQGDA